MKAKNVLLLLIVCGLYNMAGAQAKLKITNPAPRVGDEIEVRVVFNDPAAPAPEKDDYFNSNYGIKSDVKINTLITTSGNVWVGPFTFKIDGKEYTSDSVQIYVEEEFNAQKDTVSIRQVEFEGKQYLVIEQVLIGYNRRGSDFLKFKEKNICDRVSVKQSHSSNLTRAKFNFQILVYEIEKDKKYKGDCLITEQNFENLPVGLLGSNYQLK